jgi:signal transduction histidine kinase/CheY-like chemotaxis protein
VTQRSILAFVALCAALVLAHAALPVGSGLQGLAFQAAGLAAFAAAVIGILWHRGRRRPSLWLFAAGLGLLAAGDAAWNAYDHVLRVERPFPSVGDWIYLAGYVAILGSALFIRGTRRPQLGDVLDSAIVLVAAGTVLWFLLMRPAAEDTSLSLAGRFLSAAFPAVDALLLVALAQLLVSGIRSFALDAIALGIAVLFVTDVVYGLMTLQGTYVEGGLLDIGWMTATTCFGAAFLHPSIAASADDATAPRRLNGKRLAALAVVALVMPALFALEGHSETDVALLSAAAMLSTLLVLARMVLLFREHGRASASLRDAEGRRVGLLAANERLERAASALECALYEWDTETDELTWSNGLAAFGYAPGLLRTTNAWFLDHVHPEDRDRVAGTLDEVRAGADRGDGTYRFRSGAGGYRDVWDRWIARRDADGALLGVTGGLVDVTEQRQLELQLRQAQKMEAVGRLAGGVAHDFNNLLLAIRGNAELLRAERDEAEELSAILLAADRAAELTGQLLEFSRTETAAATSDLNEAVHEAEHILRRLLGADIEVETVLAADAGHVPCDRVSIEQIVINLAVNARDAMPDGGRLAIRTSRDGDEAVLVVEDDGAGMDAETARRAFDPFFTTKGVGKGTGLGLATVYAIAERAGGRIELESEVGRGSTFRVRLPAVAPPPRRRPRPEPREETGSELVLVVEDDGAVRDVVERMLQGRGYEIVTADGAGKALALVEEGLAPDLVVSDLVMPGMNGAALADRLEQLRPGQRFLFISGYSETRPDLLGENRLLRKPFTAAELAGAVRDALGRAELVRA